MTWAFIWTSVVDSTMPHMYGVKKPSGLIS
jgi:hypothetical protein